MHGGKPLKSFRDECGVFGIWNHPEASRLTYLGLYALQHRGQESAGIVTLHKTDGVLSHLHHKGLGLVADVFKPDDLDRLQGRVAIGHVRYATTGDNLLTNAQPLTAKLSLGPLAVAHNGNIVNGAALREELQTRGAIFQGTNDTEVLLHLMAQNPGKTWTESLQKSLPRLEGAFSFVILTEQSIFAARDPMGFRPLVMGKVTGEFGEESTVFASESCAFDLIGAQYIREIEPGEMVEVSAQGIRSTRFKEVAPKLARCVFEHVYFARPDSLVFSRSVYESRKAFGRELARENPIEADLVVPVPDSGVPAALGYSQESGIPFEMGIIRNHYVGRTFIEPKQTIRNFGVKIKLNPQTAILKGKRVVIIDDSLVRGTTCKKVIALVKQAGAKEVHLRIAAPPTRGPCYYGVDTPRASELIANQKSLEEIRKHVECESLAYLSLEGLYRAAQGTSQNYCAACFTQEYPTPI